MKFTIVFALLLCKIFAQEKKEDHGYCSKHCGKKVHLICELFPCEYNMAKCGKRGLGKMLTSAERKYVLDYFNGIKNNANIKHHMPKAPWSHYYALSYDYELEFMAQCMVHSCIDAKTLCAKTAKFDIISPVVIKVPIFDVIRPHSLLEVAMQDARLEAEALEEAHYTKVKEFVNIMPVMKDLATAVGCGRVYLQTPKPFMVLGCFFAPGVEIGQRLAADDVTDTNICKRCTCEWKKLCGKPHMPPIGSFKPPFKIPFASPKFDIADTQVSEADYRDTSTTLCVWNVLVLLPAVLVLYG